MWYLLIGRSLCSNFLKSSTKLTASKHNICMVFHWIICQTTSFPRNLRIFIIYWNYCPFLFLMVPPVPKNCCEPVSSFVCRCLFDQFLWTYFMFCLLVCLIRLSYNMQSADCAGAIFHSMMKLALDTTHSSRSKFCLQQPLIFLLLSLCSFGAVAANQFKWTFVK